MTTVFLLNASSKFSQSCKVLNAKIGIYDFGEQLDLDRCLKI
jgi:hypothetical protein